MTSPDTNTLNGALEQLGITMAENLVTMGVSDADPSDGLTTLAQKILQVSPTPASWDGMSLDKTAGKQTLSYVDSGATPETEYCTVTAQLLDGQSRALISGVPVVFGVYKNDVLIGTTTSVNTDANGQAEFTYTSAGAGDVVVKAVPDSQSSLIQTYVIEDCLKANGSGTVSGSNEPYGQLYKLYELPTAIDVEVSAKVKSTNNCFAFALGTKTNTTSSGGDDELGSRLRMAVGRAGTILSQLAISQSSNQKSITGSSYTSNTDIACKFVRQGNDVEVWVNGSKTIDESFTYTANALYVNVESWDNNKTITYSELKVKPL